MIDPYVLHHKCARNGYCVNPFAFGILDLESACMILPQYGKALAKSVLVYQIDAWNGYIGHTYFIATAIRISTLFNRMAIHCTLYGHLSLSAVLLGPSRS
jgi:hypothetical protein